MELKKRLKHVNIYLIGMMGSGKSTVGKVLAQQLGYQFFDTDDLVEQVAGRSIRQIFAEAGEAEFRELESKVLAELSAYRQLVIATGGGIVLQQQNWSYLHHGIVVWLDVPADLLYARLRDDANRPLLQTPNPQQTLTQILSDRQSLYAQADVRFTVHSRETPEAIASRLQDEIGKVLKPESTPVQPTDLNFTPSTSNGHATDD